MNNPIFGLPEKTPQWTRNALLVALAYLVGSIIFGGYLIFQVIATPSWQLWLVTIVVFIMAISAIVTLILIQRNRLELGIWSMMIVSYVTGISVAITISGTGILLLVTAMFLSAAVAIQTLRTRQGALFITGTAAGVVMFFIDLIITTQRISSPIFQTLSYFIVPIMLILFGVVILRQFRNYSLRTKLIIVLTTVVVAAVSVIALLDDRNSRAALTAAADDRILGAASQTATRLDDLISSNLSIVRTEADSTEELAAFLEARASGQATEQDAANLATVLYSFTQRAPQDITSYALLDSQGIDVADTYKADIGVDKSSREYFQTPIKTGQPYVSPVTISPTRPGDSDLYFSSPVHNVAGQIVGVLRFSYSTRSIQTLVTQANGLAGEQSFAVLLDENHIRLAHGTTPDLVFKSVVPLDPTLLASLQVAGRMPSGTAQELSSNLPDVEAALLNMETKPVFTSASAALGGSTAETAVVKLKTQPWILYFRQPQNVFLAPIDAQTRTTLLLALVIVLVATGLAAGLSQILVTPITHLTNTAQKIAAGDLNVQARVESGDETGILAKTFNAMTAQLHDLIGTLEQRVAERTYSLELAADVSRSVSQVRDLDIMLKDAVELIRSRFDLYYVQVYLADASLTNLILQSGTGTVGAELVARAHRLPINTGSINGRATVEKRSVVISDTTASATFRPNPLLPDTRSEMAVPLLIGEKVVGVLDMQARQAGILSEETLSAFEALAGQLAIAIQNANLLAEAEQARAEVETQARRLVRTHWEEHLDAIHKSEHIGYVFEGDKVTPLNETVTTPALEEGNNITAPISVTGEPLGSLVVEMNAENQTPKNAELVATVARQVAQQIENLRLLENAERYRADAEEAARRLTREGWKTYMEARSNESLGYMYDLKEVVAANGDHKADEKSITLPLKVRDETVGKLAVMGIESDDSKAVELAETIAERLGAHIESLRQYDQTQSALAQSEKLFEASSQLTKATDLQELVKATVETLEIQEINRAILVTFNYSPTGEVDSLDIIANWWNGTGHEITPIGTHYPLDVIRVMPMFISPTPVFFNDTLIDERVDATTLQLVKRLNLRAVAVLPLLLGAHQIGALILEAEEPHNFTQDETRLFTSLSPQIATVLENRRQFERAQRQAERESMLNTISQKIQSATTVEAVLQIAARELGRALGAPLTIAQLGMKDHGN